jgi:hypothetical protein
MRIIPSIVIVSSLLILAGCTWGNNAKAPYVSPYPSTPLGISTGADLAPKTPTGGSYSAKGAGLSWMVDMTPGYASLARQTSSGSSSMERVTYTTTEDDK